MIILQNNSPFSGFQLFNSSMDITYNTVVIYNHIIKVSKSNILY